MIGPVPALLLSRGNFRLNGSSEQDWHVIDMKGLPNRKGRHAALQLPLREMRENVELLIGFSEIPVCPACGSKKLQRLMSLPAPHGKSRGLMKSARAQAAREGHLSNFSRADRRR